MDKTLIPVQPATSNGSSAPTEQLKIVIVGHVDHGKSTFVGRLFHDTGSLPEGKLEQLQKIAERRGVPFEWANLMDALQSERDQNITIDTAQIWFHTQEAPIRHHRCARPQGVSEKHGHRRGQRRSGACCSSTRNEGVQEQSRRHGYLLNLLGIRQIAVLVNKMDLQDYSRGPDSSRSNSEYRAVAQDDRRRAKESSFPSPPSTATTSPAVSTNMPWWNGPTVLETLDDFKVSELPNDQPLRFPIQDVYRFDERRILAGRVESGSIKVGDRLIFSPSNKTSTVKTIERWNAPSREHATAGESVGITLTEQIFVERGAVAALESAPPYELTRFKARVVLAGPETVSERQDSTNSNSPRRRSIARSSRSKK